VGVLVNNAGAARPLPLEQLTEQVFDEMLAVSLKSAFLLTQAVLEQPYARGAARMFEAAQPRKMGTSRF
jgi:3-oxoacyl-[acyl-carrier protein] reductase